MLAKEYGKKLILEGKVGCLIVAGGQGTRLGFDGPKGAFPILKEKSLFQIFAEKTLDAGDNLPLAIMTSGKNHDETIAFFKENHFFGLKKNQISFFTQQSIPLLDFNGETFFEAPGKIATGPYGNGMALHEFYHSRIFKEWQKRGVQYINFMPVDNALADPFDAILIGHSANKEDEATIKCVIREPGEKVGVIVLCDGKPRVIEYSELPADELEEHELANTGLFCFRMDFVERVSGRQMPLHKAKKRTHFLDLDGKTKMSKEPIAWKFEYFIFDVLEFAEKVSLLLCHREECFAPLKDDPDLVRQKITRHFRSDSTKKAENL